ncbi:MAG: hypothetical protein R2699_01515 [Acidimicrobiales bacterium]|nr:hypothetical protein [Acidimicrobiales bacterium]MCB1261318.1 hypothetical protein [Acidimicrobiales bacterium]
MDDTTAATPPDDATGRGGGDRGQVLPFAALAMVTTIGVLVLVSALGVVVVDRLRARHAADATAVAVAQDGVGVARHVASANGATLEAVRPVDGSAVEVTVRVGSARATSRAERSADTWEWPTGRVRAGSRRSGVPT